MRSYYILGLALSIFSCTSGPTDSPTEQPVEEQQSQLNQEELKKLLLPVLKTEGQLYKKYKQVYAKQANGGEVIKTITSDGLETTNTASKGDYIIKNLTDAGEQYTMSADKFNERYQLLEDKGNDGYQLYQPVGKIYAVELSVALLQKLGLAKEFYFTAPWGSAMVAKKHDFLVCPLDYSEVYRIARKEFFETYQLAQE